MSGLRSLGLDDLDDLLTSAEVPAVVDFWAADCPPCDRMAAEIVQLADEYEGRVCFGAVDVSTNPELAARYDITSVPTVIIFVAGEPVRTLIGARPRRHLVREVEQAVHMSAAGGAVT